MPSVTSPPRSELPFGRRRRRWISSIIIWLLFLAALGIRWSGQGDYPRPHQTDDEYSNLWSGMSMVRGEQPKSWHFLGDEMPSLLGHLSMTNKQYPIHQPAYDHPQFFRVLVGLAATSVGAEGKMVKLTDPDTTTELWYVSLKKLRLFPLGMYAVSFWLLWWLVCSVTGRAAALVAMGVYTFTEYMVMHQRLTVPDNFLAMLLPGIFLALEKWRAGRLGGRAAGGIVFTLMTMAVMSKLVALAFVPAVAGWSLARTDRGGRGYGPLVWSMAGGVAGLAIFVALGVAGNAEVFFATLSAHSGRFCGFDGFYRMIGTQMRVDTPASVGWIVGGWLLTFCLAARVNGGARGVLFAGLGFAFGYAFFAPADWYGWHLCALFPVFSLAWGVALREGMRRPGGLFTVLVLVFLGIAVLSAGQVVVPRALGVLRYGYLILVGVALVRFPWGLERMRLRLIRWLIVGGLVVGFGLEVAKLQVYQEVARIEREKEKKLWRDAEDSAK